MSAEVLSQRVEPETGRRFLIRRAKGKEPEGQGLDEPKFAKS